MLEGVDDEISPQHTRQIMYKQTVRLLSGRGSRFQGKITKLQRTYSMG